MKTDVKCTYCGKFLFSTDTPEENRGRIANEVTRRGFVAKIPFLYGHSRFEYFCNKECCKAWFKENITEEARENGNESLSHIKEKMESEEFRSGLQNGLARIQEIFKKHIKNYRQ